MFKNLVLSLLVVVMALGTLGFKGQPGKGGNDAPSYSDTGKTARSGKQACTRTNSGKGNKHGQNPCKQKEELVKKGNAYIPLQYDQQHQEGNGVGSVVMLSPNVSQVYLPLVIR